MSQHGGRPVVNPWQQAPLLSEIGGTASISNSVDGPQSRQDDSTSDLPRFGPRHSLEGRNAFLESNGESLGPT
jgi:hypothetical protein